MGPYFPRLRRDCVPSLGPLPRAALWSSNHIQRLANGIGVFHTVRGRVDPRKLYFLPRLVELLETWSDRWTGHGTLSSSRVELAQYKTPSQSETGLCGVGISTSCGQVSTPVISVFIPGCWCYRCMDGFLSRDRGGLSSLGGACYMYEPW